MAEGVGEWRSEGGKVRSSGVRDRSVRRRGWGEEAGNGGVREMGPGRRQPGEKGEGMGVGKNRRESITKYFIREQRKVRDPKH